jgi:hypothetical protein
MTSRDFERVLTNIYLAATKIFSALPLEEAQARARARVVCLPTHVWLKRAERMEMLFGI